MALLLRACSYASEEMNCFNWWRGWALFRGMRLCTCKVGRRGEGRLMLNEKTLSIRSPEEVFESGS
jgi:hypothetical protein